MVDKNNIVANFYKSLEEKGYKGKIVSAKHIPELRQDVRKHHEAKLLDPEFYEEYKPYFEFESNVDFPEIKSLFIISVPQPQFEAVFHWNNKKISLLIPPTYLYGLKVINEMIEFLTEIWNNNTNSSPNLLNYITGVLHKLFYLGREYPLGKDLPDHLTNEISEFHKMLCDFKLECLEEGISLQDELHREIESFDNLFEIIDKHSGLPQKINEMFRIGSLLFYLFSQNEIPGLKLKALSSPSNRDRTLVFHHRGEKILKKVKKRRGISPLYSSRKAIDHPSFKD